MFKYTVVFSFSVCVLSEIYLLLQHYEEPLTFLLKYSYNVPVVLTHMPQLHYLSRLVRNYCIWLN